MKPSFWFMLVLVLGTACAQSSTTPDANPPIAWDICAMPDIEEREASERNWSWKDLQEVEIGSSSSEDLITRFGKPKSIRPWLTSNQEIACRYEYSDDKPVFWVFDDKVIGIEFSGYRLQSQTNPFALPVSISEAEASYGRPEIVSWSMLGSGYRTVVWRSKGILAEVVLVRNIDNSQIASIFFIPPMNEAEFKNSIWTERISSTRSTSDSVDGWSLNPFQWD